MVDTEALPGDWSVSCQRDDSGMEVRRFQLDRDGGGLFVVWVFYAGGAAALTGVASFLAVLS